jgi:hypothetical protein
MPQAHHPREGEGSEIIESPKENSAAMQRKCDDPDLISELCDQSLKRC